MGGKRVMTALLFFGEALAGLVIFIFEDGMDGSVVALLCF